ncbi:hypothetical protein JCM17846_18350 [Iodidimonas nitroreducens]|uniref:Uncharacterized protein n=2 Tax=Iodidimonas nitroreducens TaxID=1236968 RepID=A0A5A7N751_9PROT|nr:hypothetical protein JCM17846_18350 [Iodidimonas nitroreducens]
MVALGHGQIAWRLAAIHVTYLAADGADKADLRDPDTGDPLPSRRIYGHPIGAVAPLGPPALLSDARMGPLLVGEGLESTWAVAQMLMEQHGPMRVAAVLSLANFQGGWLRDRDGCFDPHAPISDPASPPWLLPDPGDVIVAIDADMAPVRIFARGPMRRRTETMLDAGGRAALCASLARQAWRRVGARSVRVVRPRMGADFNDQIREKA